MTQIRKFLGLPPAERRLLLRAWVLVATIRLGLWTLSFQRLRRILDGAASRRSTREELSVERVVWAVEAASRRVPAATCLTQAMAAQILLGRCGQDSCLRIGVTRDQDRKFTAHAWIEIQGRVILGGPDIASYAPLPRLSPKVIDPA